jgi:3-oxoacyl-[acyl-carrier protein] reductase
MDLGLDGNAALVTASSAGLGKGCARALAREGANVTICGRDPDRLADAEAELDGLGDGEVAGVRTDLTDPDDVAALVEATAERYGGIDHAVLSSGGPPSGPFHDMDDEDWHAAYDGLVMSAVRTLRAARPHLVESDHGSVVAITSVSVAEAIDGLVLSNAVRRAVSGLVQTLAREWAPDVRVNSVLPGTHETGRIQDLIEESVERGEYPDYEAGREGRVADTPLGAMGDPDDFGAAVAFLASPRAPFITGAELPIDGGRLQG